MSDPVYTAKHTSTRLVSAGPICRKCRARPSTGYFIELCDPCFDEFESKIKTEASASPTGLYELPETECEYLADSVFDRSKS